MSLILGLDPGLAPTGWGLVRRDGCRTAYVAHGVLRTDPAADDHARVQELARGLSELLAARRPDLVAIERWVHYGQSESTQAHGLGLVIGALVAAAGSLGVPTVSLSRAQDWRTALGLPRDATKAQAQERVRVVLGLAAPVRPQHASDALAVAVVAAPSARPLAPASPRVMRVPWSPRLDGHLQQAMGAMREGRAQEVSLEVGGVRLILQAPTGGAR